MLLHSNTEDTLRLLEELDINKIAGLKETLILLWQVYPDVLVQNKAQALLSTFLNDSEKKQIEENFSIFKSIAEYFPWMGDYKALQQKNFQKFVQIKAPYERLLVESPVLVEYYLDLGRKLYMMFELTDEAQICFEDIIKYDNKNDEALYALGRLAEREQKIDTAKDFYECCIDANGKHVYALLQLGTLKAAFFNDARGAIEHYNKVLEIEPYMTEVQIRMAEAHYALGDVKRAKQFIEIVLSINEYHEEALNLLGQIQWHHYNEIEEAIETFQKGIDHKIHGDSALLLTSLGDLYNTHLDDHDKARVYYEKSLKVKPNQVNTLRKLVALLETVYQDFGAIAQHYDNFFLVEKRNAAVYVEYAQFLVKYVHDYDFAQLQLKNALAIDPQNEEALKLSRQISNYVQEDNKLDPQQQNSNENNLDLQPVEYSEEEDDDDDDFEGGDAAGDN